MLFAASPFAAHAQQTAEKPLTASERWSYYLRRTYGPTRMGLLGVDTAIDHALHDPSCWDSAAGSFGLRYARAFDRRLIKNTAEFAGGLLTGEDLRYRSSPSPVFRNRVWNAVRSSMTARMPDARMRPAYTRFFAVTLVNVSTAHWTDEAIEPGWLIQSLAWCLLDQIETNLLDEFRPDLRRIGTKIRRRIGPRHDAAGSGVLFHRLAPRTR